MTRTTSFICLTKYSKSVIHKLLNQVEQMFFCSKVKKRSVWGWWWWAWILFILNLTICKRVSDYVEVVFYSFHSSSCFPSDCDPCLSRWKSVEVSDPVSVMTLNCSNYIYYILYIVSSDIIIIFIIIISPLEREIALLLKRFRLKHLVWPRFVVSLYAVRLSVWIWRSLCEFRGICSELNYIRRRFHLEISFFLDIVSYIIAIFSIFF